ncbi:hypothetical protein DH2020_016859 [Rehmannia glutinosa]|uniref:Bifunctional inhibitor/plant lipid transfer protein/seed storage helical domain-containing protein n=1 Tax=Rehmannia glutinosa TaxID=99300 RepID=A0ABR0WQA5_REHGL
MAKLTVFAAIFAALIALATASTYTTVVTTTVVDEENPQQCQREIQQMRMTHCMQYMQTRSSGSQYEPSFLRSAVANPRYQEEHLQECCDELKSVSSDCRGDAVRHLIKEMKQRYRTEEEMQQMIKDKAHALPSKCNLKGRTAAGGAVAGGRL